MTQNNYIALLWTLRSFRGRVLQAVIDSHGEQKSTNPRDKNGDAWLNFYTKRSLASFAIFFHLPNFTGILLIYFHHPRLWKQIFFSYPPSLCNCLFSIKQIFKIPFWDQVYENKALYPHIKFNCYFIIGENTSHNYVSEPEPDVLPLSTNQVNH